MKRIRRMLSVLLALVLVFSAAPAVWAAQGNVTYSGDSGRFLFEPGSRYSPTDLFPDFKDVMPGDSITQRIYVENAASRRVKVRIYMRALGAHEDSVEFLSQMNLTVEKVADTILFDAPAHRRAQLADWTYLGTLYSGGATELKVTLDVPVEMDNRFQNAVGHLDWEFMVEELPVEPTDPQPPKTGDVIARYVIILMVSAAALILLLFLYRKKKNNKE